MNVDDDTEEISVWWEQLSDADRNLLKQAVRQYPADPAIIELLVSAGEPMKSSWSATSVEGAESAVTIHGRLEAFIEDQLDDSPLY